MLDLFYDTYHSTKLLNSLEIVVLEKSLELFRNNVFNLNSDEFHKKIEEMLKENMSP